MGKFKSNYRTEIAFFEKSLSKKYNDQLLPFTKNADFTKHIGKTGRGNKKYSAEFKIGVIIDMREHHLGYRETARKYWEVSRGQDLNYINTVKR